VAVALLNGIWLLAQGGAAGIVLGVFSLLSGTGCLLFVILNRQRIEFSAHLLATVASLTRAYPGTIYVAIGAACVLLLWTLIWVAAVSYTSQMRAQVSVLVLLVLSYTWGHAESCMACTSPTGLRATVSEAMIFHRCVGLSAQLAFGADVPCTRYLVHMLDLEHVPSQC
jgi:hypothetical protein